MNAAQAYRQAQSQTSGQSRIDLLLALFDGATERLGRAQAALAIGDHPAAVNLVARVQLIVMELVGSVRIESNAELSTNLLRLYEFVSHQLVNVTAESLSAATQVLSTVADGFRSIRDEAVNLEKAGEIPTAVDAAVLAVSV